MLIDAGLVLEGGGTRCVFTIGILDYLMEHDIYFKNVYALSASSYIGMNYISKQPGRMKKVLVERNGSELFSWKSFFLTGNIYNRKLLFEKIPNGPEFPFDYETFFNSEQKFTFSVTSLITGKQEYYSEWDGPEDLMKKCLASNAFPVLSRIQHLNGKPYLDGGMADAIPLRKSISDGVKKNVVVLTQQHGFRKKLEKANPLIRIRYRKYKNFIRTVDERPYQYNSELDYIDELVEKGDVFAIYPELEQVRLITRKKQLLDDLYEHGYKTAERLLPQILKWIEEQ